MGASGERARAGPLSASLRSVWSSLWALSRLLLLRMRSNRERERRLGDVIEDSWGSEQSAGHCPKPAQTEVDQGSHGLPSRLPRVTLCSLYGNSPLRRRETRLQFHLPSSPYMTSSRLPPPAHSPLPPPSAFTSARQKYRQYPNALSPTSRTVPGHPNPRGRNRNLQLRHNAGSCPKNGHSFSSLSLLVAAQSCTSLALV